MSLARRSILPWIYGGSLAAHMAFAAVTALLPTPERSKDVAIELADIKKKKSAPKPPPPVPPPPPEDKPKPPPPRPTAAQAKIAQEPAKIESAPPPEVGADGFANLEGVSLGGGGEGVPVGGPATGAEVGAARSAAAPKATAHRVEQLAAAVQTACSEPVVKPKVKKPGSIKYTKQAQEAEIEGVVRVQVTIDESGHVLSARLLSGLGYGLDDIALTAAHASEFEPATLCGKPVVGTKILAITFELR